MYLAAIGVGILRLGLVLSGLVGMLLTCPMTSAIAQTWWPHYARYYLMAATAAVARDGGDVVVYLPLCVLGVYVWRMAMGRCVGGTL
ncbi:hypothetical protein L226DRAFT_537182 [Lentinus tigrinus ALCF2SS1-7]|uniref:uncharacterized protein n=1 Tax=Lentinus tigrinus ALCF2SS1-7 TaxID=1328758 RepID=UPI001165D0AF|nr:hypothetical protein L226DRAFT_537182 [Lentinus tigrinus ALCF2SS1-7]